jgi:hypothetical protein
LPPANPSSDGPPAGVPLDDLRGGRGSIGADQGQVVAGRGPVADQHDGDGPGAETEYRRQVMTAAWMVAVVP